MLRNKSISKDFTTIMIDQEHMRPSPLTKLSLDDTNKDIVSNKNGLLNIDHDLNYEIQKEALESVRARKNAKTVSKESTALFNLRKSVCSQKLPF
jgi:hypothetical protein